MLAHKFSHMLKRVLPKPVAMGIRAVGTACLTPIHFSVDTGHFRSALLGRAVDRHGRPLPWYTYAAIDFLAAHDYSGRRVLEFGGGQSTLWWAQRADHVVALEEDAAWFDFLRPRLPANTDLRLVRGRLEDHVSTTERGTFDIVVVDGLDRLQAARFGLNLVAKDGAIVVDDSQGYWGGDEDRSHPIIESLQAAGFQRVDFYGFAPGTVLARCTSVFFKSRCFLVNRDEGPSPVPPTHS